MNGIQKGTGLFTLFLILLTAKLFAQNIHHDVFKSGEELKYIIRYGFIRGGEAKLKVISTKEDFHGKPAIHFLAEGRTSGTLDIFYKVRNQYESYIDPETFLPLSYSENIQENKYKRSGTTEFDYSKKEAINNSGQYAISSITRDILSAYYYARSIDISKLKVGDKVSFSYFLENSVSPLEIVYLGKEKVDSPTGTYECLKFSPSLEPGRIFKKESKMYLWISNDENHIPIKAKADILLGSVIMELKEFKNLNRPLAPLTKVE